MNNNNNESSSSSNSNDSTTFDPNAGRRLLSTSYRSFSPYDMGDRYVTFLLRNERTMSSLQRHVLMDHLAVIRQLCGGGGSGGEMENNVMNGIMMNLDGMNNTTNDSTAADGDDNNNSNNNNNTSRRTKKKKNASIEIDAFQLLSLDPVLGNLTLRYPDTLLELLEDSTVQARRVLRRRMEVSISSSLDRMKRTRSELAMNVTNDVYKREINNMIQLLKALQHTKEWYNPRPLHARLVHLPPHMACCKPTLSSITAKDVGTVVQICGTCVKSGPVRMMETIRTYQCLGKGCGHKFMVNADFGTTNNALPQPIVCPSDNITGGGGLDNTNDEYYEPCKSTSFAIVPNESEHADYQEIKVQESASALNRVGSVPRSILIKLSDDLVDRCNPGDEVVVVGSLHAEWQNHSLGPNVEVMVGMSMRAHSVRVINIEEEFAGGGGGGGSSSSMADLGLMSGNGGMKDAATVMAASSGNLREKFRREFEAFWSDPGAKRRPIATRDYIVRAVCPKLYGMHAVKLGLLLVLIGGASISTADDEGDTAEESGDNTNGQSEEVHIDCDSDEEAPVAFDIGGGNDDDNDDQKKKKNKSTNGGNHKSSNTSKGKTVKTRRRIQSHILLIGDPGTGKSQFLRFAAALSPRSVLTTGTGSSTAGLTCAAVRDSSAGSNGNEFSLEAGALALADRGVCCIDEFGCMSKEDRTSIHEAMEQQTISVAKAGIICKLNARATVVAVMNPNGGIYDETLSLEQNSRLGSALLSRFDLIFVMLDQADSGRDINIAHFLLQQSIIPGSGYDKKSPLEMETLFNDDNTNGHWGMEKLRSYIATIREKFHPIVSPEAAELLEKHYSLCRQQKNGESLITVRFLESLIRLSQAHARLMYRDTVLLDDAVAVILLMECTAAASSGPMHAGNTSSYDNQFDDISLAKNPIDSEFLPFDEVDAQFEKEKEFLLQRYQGNNNTQQFSDGTSPPNFRRMWEDSQSHQLSFPANGQHQQLRNDLRDQWGRQKLSQATSPHPYSQQNNSNSIRQAIGLMDPNQYTPAGPQPKSIYFSQQVPAGTAANNGFQQYERPMLSQPQQRFEPTRGNVRQEGGDFIRAEDQMRGHDQERGVSFGNTLSISQQIESFQANALDPNPTSLSQQSISGKRRKKRRTAD